MPGKKKKLRNPAVWIEITALAVVFALAAILVMTCGNKTRTEAENEAPAMIADSVLSADSVTIHYNVCGAGEHSLVFAHCWSGDSRYWDNQIDAFKDKFKLVTIDLAGHGKSGTNRDDWTMAAYGADVAAVINKLGLKNVILVGHSMGGPVSIEAARLIPDKIIAIIGVDNFQDLTKVYSVEEAEGWLASFKADFPNTAKSFIRSFFTEKSDSAVVDWIINDMSAAPPEIAISSLRSVITFNAPEALKGLNKPIFCINSDHVPTNIEGNRQLVPSFDVKYMPGYGHFIQMENPAEFNRLLQEILNEFWPPDDSMYD